MEDTQISRGNALTFGNNQESVVSRIIEREDHKEKEQTGLSLPSSQYWFVAPLQLYMS